MSLSTGTRFGAFEIVEAIGAGGMGEVYRATDVNLARDVAIKVLPSSLAADADRSARFEREARTLAALNHPNVAHVYGLERSGTLHGLVMELVDGDTLAERIARGPLDGDEAVRVALQIAAALEAAHQRGIVHRDLKPANVKIKTDGTVKVLDFGIAKIVAGDTSAPSPDALTQTGFVVGTAAYMSPEQARGLPVDQRSDIWSFGCVLYEMLTGRPAFGDGGDSAAPDLAETLPASTARNVRRTLRLCLQRSPSLRLADIRDVRLALEGAFDSGTPDLSNTSAARRTIAPWAVTLVAAAVAASSWAWFGARSIEEPSPRRPVRVALDLGAVSPGTNSPVATLSPDGNRIAFVAIRPDGVEYLATRRLDQAAATPLPGTEGARSPFFSPDGEWVGFFTDGKLKKTRVDGGLPIELCNAPAGRGASWGENGMIVAALTTSGGLQRVSASDGTVSPFTELGSVGVNHRWPQVLPGGNAVLFMIGHVSGNYSAADIAVASLDGDGPARVKVIREAAGMAPHYVDTGHIVYVANGVLYALPFDVAALEVRGEPFPVIDDLSAAVGLGYAQLAFSSTGNALYRGGKASGRTVVHWLAASGTPEVFRPEPGLYQYPRVSPNGERLAIVIADGLRADIWVYDKRGSTTRITYEGVNTSPVWTPSNRYLVFQAQSEIYAARADGSQPPSRLTSSENPLRPTSFTPDGKHLVFFEQLPSGAAAVRTVAIDETADGLRAGPIEPLFETPSGIPMPALSRDGKSIAYASAETGTYEIYVRAFPNGTRKSVVSTAGGNFPVWSPTADELFYRTEDQILMAVSFTVADDEPHFGEPRVWSEQRLFSAGLIGNFDLAPDGERFAVLLPAEDPSSLESHPLMLHVGFFDELRRRESLARKQRP